MKRLALLLLVIPASTQAENLNLNCFFDRDYTTSTGMSIEANLFSDEITVEKSHTKHTSNYEIKKKKPSLVYWSYLLSRVSKSYSSYKVE